MPVYATTQDLIDRFGEEELVQLTDRDDPPAGVVDTSVADAALDEADRIIDGYVGIRYSLPIAAPVPGLLKDLARNLARQFLYQFDSPDHVKSAHDRAMKTLDGISKGTVVLDAAGVPPATSGDRVQTSGPDRVFTSDSLKGFSDEVLRETHQRPRSDARAAASHGPADRCGASALSARVA